MSTKTKRLVISALLLAAGLVLPFLTGGIPNFGRMLLPMHLPVLLCGFVCGWKWGLLCDAPSAQRAVRYAAHGAHGAGHGL